MTIFRAVYYGWEGIEEEYFFSTKELAETFIELYNSKDKKKRKLDLEEITPISNKEEFGVYINA